MTTHQPLILLLTALISIKHECIQARHEAAMASGKMSKAISNTELTEYCIRFVSRHQEEAHELPVADENIPSPVPRHLKQKGSENLAKSGNSIG